MRKWIFICLLLVAARAQAQQIDLTALDKLGPKAKEKTEVTLDASMLQFASGFLTEKSKEESAAKKITSDLKGVYVRTYEFDKAGQFSPADLDPVRAQLKGPNWSRILNVKERDGDDVEMWLYREGELTTGMILIAVEPEEVTVINLVGPMRAEDIRSLGGQFGIPKVQGITKE